jgi:hypothetical protein
VSRNKELWACACWAAALAATLGLLAATPGFLAPALAQSAPPQDPSTQAAPELRGGETELVGGSGADALPDLATSPAPSESPPPKPPKRAALPPLAPYPRAARLALRGGEPVEGTPAPTVAALPAPPPRRKIKRDDKPFDPVGLYVGNLRLTPYFEQNLGYASNPYGASSGAKGSGLSNTEIGVGLQSNWSQGELTGSAKLGYNDYFQTPGASAPYGSGLLDYRYDASRDLAFDTEGRFNVATETNAQLGLAGQTTQSLTMVSTYGATLGATQKFGDLSIGLHGTVDRSEYEGGSLATDDYNDYGLKLRAGYRLSEAVQPFAEIGGDARVYDSRIDASGYDRASDGVYGKAGLKLSFSEMLTGEASAGYGEREYRDPRLPDVAAPLFDASLIWSATPLTTVTLKTATLLQDAVVAGASADIDRSYTINLDHALTERVKFGLNGGITTDEYVGDGQNTRTYTIGATAEYHLSREVVLKASATHQQLVSNLPGSSYTADTVMLGVRLQR